MSKEAVRAGGLDWAQRWRDMYAAEREQAEAVTPSGLVDPHDYWASTAGRFGAAARRSPQPDSFMQFVLPRLLPSDVVADVGAGSGRYISTLATAARQVIAVEPSQAMRDQLQASAGEQGLSNVAVVAEAWPANIGPVDVAICAHVLYGVADAAPFLLALDASVTRGCYLLLALTHPTTGLGVFWQRFRGEERLPLPAALETLNLCHQLGIRANMSIVPMPLGPRYVDAEEALVDVRFRLRFAPDAARDVAIAQAIDELLEPRGGELLPPGTPTHAAVIWWKKDG